MGLTIHYTLGSDTALPAEARRLVEALRQRALDLPLAEVGELVEFEGDDCRMERHDDPCLRWLLAQAAIPFFPEGRVCEAEPLHVVAFRTWPGEGCEAANFGLCRYPAEVVCKDGSCIPIDLPGWAWQSFCKTQYASNPDCGGVENFLRCHLSVVGVIDSAAKLGLSAEVVDESGFHEDRSVEELAAEVMRWNRGIAAFTGQLKDLVGGEFAAEITRFPNFERLEAEGRRDENGPADDG